MNPKSVQDSEPADTREIPEGDRNKTQNEFGGKKIGFAASFVLNINNSMGPAMVLLPLLNQSAGWLTPSLALVIFFLFSTFAGTMLCEAMQRIPGNRNFEAQPRYEFATTVQHYYGKVAYVFFQIFYVISLQAFNIVGMIIAAQMFDMFIFRISKHGYALDYSKMKILEACAGYNDTSACFERNNVFSSDQVVSIGFIVCMVICIPFGYINLDANMGFQWFSFFGLLALTAEFVVQFILNTIPSLPWYKNGTADFAATSAKLDPAFNLAGQPQVLGLSVLAYAYIVTIPSWVNEKKRGVSVNKSLWYPAIVACIMKMCVGVTGSMAFQLYNRTSQTMMPGADDIVGSLLSFDMPLWTQFCAYSWVLTTIIPGIPVMAIMVRYNLQAGGWGKRTSFFIGVVAPWIITLFCYQYNQLTEICSWVGNVVSGFVNFALPTFLFYSARRRYPRIDGDLESYLPSHETTPLLSTPSGSRVNSRRSSLAAPSTDGMTQVYPKLDNDDDDNDSKTENLNLAINVTSGNFEKDSDIDDDDEKTYLEPPVNAVPSWLLIKPTVLALIIGITFTIISIGFVGILIYASVVGDDS
eukprot:m.28864 g.28864  ORF g.28864 m.28864 type:complete len:583 (+) comp31085_c0_seq2:86-1834(+)